MDTTVPRDINNTDFRPIHSMDFRDWSLLASASVYHMLWQDATDNHHHIPEHLTPGASFSAYNEPSHAEALELIPDTGDDCGFINSCQSPHQDWCTRGTCSIPIDWFQNAVQFPPSTFDFNQAVTTGDVVPFSDLSGLPPVPSHLWTEDLYPLMQNFGPCDSLMKELTATGHVSCGVFNSFDLGSHSQSTPQSPHEDPSNDSVHKCEWSVNGSPCNTHYPAGDNLKHYVSRHLSKTHNLTSAGGKSTLKCRWLGCTKELKSESIARHIITVHLHITTACKGCGTSFARQDSLQRHMRNSCGAKEER